MISVECYHSDLDTFTPVTEMSVRRCGADVGVLDGVLYAVGGYNGLETLFSFEAYRPKTGVWTTIAGMNLCRQNAGVVALDGLLYVVGRSDRDDCLNSVEEVYNPLSNTWSMLEASMNAARCRAGVVAICPSQHVGTICRV